MTRRLKTRNTGYRSPRKQMRISSLCKAFSILVILVFVSSLLLFFALPVPYNEEWNASGVVSFHKRLQESRMTGKLPQDQWMVVRQHLLLTTNRTFLPLTAYVEPPLRKGTPLPVRGNAKNLRKYTYPSVQSCRDLQNSLPVDHPVEMDTTYGPNVGVLWPSYPLRDEYAASVCPVDADPFLPWIHDVFPTSDGKYIEFVAHNKRRCKSGPTFSDDLTNLEPQVAIMQSIPVKRLTTDELRHSAPNWQQRRDNHTQRYRLASLEEADEDGRETRFICHFHTLRPNQNGSVEKVVLGETLSAFPYNYEHANFRKGANPHPMLTRPKNADDTHGAHNEDVWNSVLHFRCPVPSELQRTIRLGDGVVGDGTTLYLDLVPIRTPARETREGYCPQVVSSSFDPKKQWGDAHVLPIVEESGRWANIPICRPAARNEPEAESSKRKPISNSSSDKDQKHFLVGCLWASAAFKTRGTGATLDTSTPLRLLEWLAYHLYVAEFDHVYVYDNTEAYTNQTSLKPILDLFPPDRVTRIPWKHRICNNNNNAGERSSQYTAETSCRLRYGPTTEWLISLDTDEYLIPQGNWTSVQEWLSESLQSGKISKDTHVLSFFQTRAKPNVDFMEAYHDDGKQCGAATEKDAKCLAKSENTTFLQAYDCEPTKLPKPDWAWRAKKQIYRPGFVLNHFVHYTTVTRRIHEAPNERSPAFVQQKPYERRVDELTEAFMLHTKTTKPIATKDWRNLCQGDNNKNCPVGIAWPLKGDEDSATNQNKGGFGYNCYPHGRIQDLSKRLRNIMDPLLKRYRG